LLASLLACLLASLLACLQYTCCFLWGLMWHIWDQEVNFAVYRDGACRIAGHVFITSHPWSSRNLAVQRGSRWLIYTITTHISGPGGKVCGRKRRQVPDSWWNGTRYVSWMDVYV
jgi:hypothetical protein